MRVIRTEYEAVSADAVFGIMRNYTVCQTSRSPDYGYGAVSARNHLRQSARFLLARHQEDIRARIYFARKISVICYDCTTFTAITLGNVSEIIFVFAAAFA